MPYIWHDPTDEGWELNYQNYAVQAIGIYLVICLAAAWFGTRVRQEIMTAPSKNRPGNRSPGWRS